MKKAFLLLWCWLALAVAFWIIQFFIVQSAWIADATSPILLGTSVVLSALGTWLLSKRDLHAWARWLAILYVALFTAAALAVFVFFCLIPVYGLSKPQIALWCIPAALAGLVAGVLMGRKGILRGLVVVAVILVLTFAVVAVPAH